MGIADDLMRDVIDVHCHIDREFDYAGKRALESEWLPVAHELGMRGVVLKSHWWPTANVVPYLKTGRMDVWGSVTLNYVAGGPTRTAVETCARFGGKVVFLPTWQARHDIEHGGMSARLQRYVPTFDAAKVNPYYFLEGGTLTANAHEVLESCREFELVLGTGHVSWEECRAFVEEARHLHFSSLLINHPLNPRTNVSLEELRWAGEHGAFIEVCWTQMAPGRLAPEQLVAKMRAIGLEHIVLSTDRFRAESPQPPLLMRDFLKALHVAGLTRDEIQLVAALNPARLLGVGK